MSFDIRQFNYLKKVGESTEISYKYTKSINMVKTKVLKAAFKDPVLTAQ
jgi:hypothetical protein